MIEVADATKADVGVTVCSEDVDEVLETTDVVE